MKRTTLCPVVGILLSVPFVNGCVLLPAAAIVGSGAAGAAGAGAILAAPDNCIPPWEMHQWGSRMAMKFEIRKPCPPGSTEPTPFLKGQPSEKPNAP